MKLPSLLRLPKNKRFNYHPRYYDPIKEELEEKESKFRHQLSEEGKKIRHASISETYKRRSRIEKRSDSRQIIFILAFTIIIFGYIYVGNYVFFSLLVLIPLYIWMRLRKT
jgi:hypothetical protein